jgi:hyperosmotically inducible periplasmic protein
MNSLQRWTSFLFLALAITVAGCANKNKSRDVSSDVRKSLDDAGLTDVKVSQDRDMGVVTLGGKVTNDADKARAESLARSIAGEQVIANQIAVLPPGAESDTKAVMSDVDKGIDKLLDAALIQNGYKDDVKYSVKNGVVTLTGDVNSPAKRIAVEQVAKGVPNVTQVVNELQVKEQKARSSK